MQPQVYLLRLEHRHAMPLDTCYQQGLLSAEEAKRATRFRDPLARQQFWIGRVLLRSLLAQALARPPQTLNFVIGPNGKPSLPDAPLHFNLSHSAGVIACAIAAQPIGVDVETQRHSIDILSIARQHFSNEEFAWLDQKQKHRCARFTALWSLKEAYLKGIGLGIATDLSSMQWQAQGPRNIAVSSTLTPHAWFCQLRRPFPQYWLGVAYPEPSQIRVHKLQDIASIGLNC